MISKSAEPSPNGKDDLSEAEIAARFEATVRRMANTPPEPKPDKRAAPAIKTKKAPKASS